MNQQPAGAPFQERVLILFAVSHEAAPFRRELSRFPSARILVSGMGRHNAIHVLQTALQRQKPDLVLTCGFAGGLNPALKPGAVVFQSSHPSLEARLRTAGSEPARFVCATRIATTASEKKLLREHSQADAVEMESEAVQELCHNHGIPCATVRAISDAAHEDLPVDFNQLTRADMSLNYGKLAWEILKSPGLIAGLLKLQKNSGTAASRLSEVLVRFLSIRG